MEKIYTNTYAGIEEVKKFMLQNTVYTLVSKNKSSKWEFKANSKDFINFEEIIDTLTGENPLALVVYGDTEKYVVVSWSLYVKASKLDIGLPLFSTLLMDLEDGAVFSMDSNCNAGIFKEWIKWAKKVKEAPWPKDGRKDNVVKVSLPKI